MAKTFVLRSFICPNCLRTLNVSKKASRRTPVGHIKHMWCPYCKTMQGFVQQESDNSIYR